MDGSLFTLVTLLVALVGFDLAAIRYGRDSRRTSNHRRDWW
jgi:hypothetical protein